MIPRDWTLTDQACADDDERHRRWWKRAPFAEDGSQTPRASDGEGFSEGEMPTEHKALESES